jgi:predicted kinase
MRRRARSNIGTKPVVYMLCGFVASGKTTYARQLEADGCVRLAIDEWIYERYGRHGIDYEESEYPRHEAEALVDLDRQLLDLIRQGKNVVLDYGFWSREWRDRYKRLIEDAGASWRLLYFRVELPEISRRLAQRNRLGGANALVVTSRHFAEFLTRWQPPVGEGEEVTITGSKAPDLGETTETRNRARLGDSPPRT